MSKSSRGGLVSLLAGVAMGAAAMFFSNENNRKKAQVAVSKTGKKVAALKKAYKENPKAVRTQLKKDGQKLATKVVKAASKATKKATKKKK